MTGDALAARRRPASRPDAATVGDVVRRTLAAPPSLGSGRLVCVDGPSGSGKTTFAACLRRSVPRDVSCRVVHLDDLYPGWDGLRAGVAHVAAHVVAPMARGEAGRYLRYDWIAGRPGDWVDVPRVDLLVLEGVGSGALAYADRVTTLVWVVADADVRLARGVARDGVASRANLTQWMADEAPYLTEQRTRERADVVLRT